MSSIFQLNENRSIGSEIQMAKYGVMMSQACLYFQEDKMSRKTIRTRNYTNFNSNQRKKIMFFGDDESKHRRP